MDLIKELNKDADSVSLHDCDLVKFAIHNNILKLTYGLGEISYYFNEPLFNEVFPDPKNNMLILSQEFEIEEFKEISLFSRATSSDLLINQNRVLDDGSMLIYAEESLSIPLSLVFKFKSFKWVYECVVSNADYSKELENYQNFEDSIFDNMSEGG